VAEYSVRVRGIDTPELRGANCPQEKLWAEEAKAQVEKLYDVGLTVMLEDVAFDAYSGRVDAHVRRWVSDRWKFLADELVDRGLAEAWTPEMPKIDWCDLAKAR
jgi:endonuclease YncB( thermonuclease family)